MPKLRRVTEEEMADLKNRASDLNMDMRDFDNRLQKQYEGDLRDPTGLGRSFLSLARAANDLASTLLAQAEIKRMKGEADTIRAKLAEKQA